MRKPFKASMPGGVVGLVNSRSTLALVAPEAQNPQPRLLNKPRVPKLHSLRLSYQKDQDGFSA